MHDLQLVGFTTDRRGLIFRTATGARTESYVVPITDELLAVVAELASGADADPTTVEPAAPAEEPAVDDAPARPTSQLSVRDIQARLRAGESVARVAREAGVDDEWIERFAPPVRAEQRRIVERALDAHLQRSRGGPSAVPLRRAVGIAMAERGVAFTVPAFEAAWSAHLLGHDRWAVEFRYRHRGERTARWVYDAGADELTTADRTASQLGHVPETAQPARDAGAAVDGIVGDTSVATPIGAPTPPTRTRTSRAAASTRKQAPAKKAASSKATAKKATAKKASTKKATAKKATAKKATAKKATAKKASTKKATAKKAAGKKAAATKAASTKAAATKAASTKAVATARRAGPSAAAPSTAQPSTVQPSTAPSSPNGSVDREGAPRTAPQAGARRADAPDRAPGGGRGAVRTASVPGPVAARPDPPADSADAPSNGRPAPAAEPAPNGHTASHRHLAAPTDGRPVAARPAAVELRDVPLAAEPPAPRRPPQLERVPDDPAVVDSTDRTDARRARAAERAAPTVRFRSGSAQPVRSDGTGAANPASRRRRQLRAR